MSSDDSNQKMKLYFIRHPEHHFEPVEKFLRNREFETYSAVDFKEALTDIIRVQPHIVFVCLDHSNKKILAVPKLLAQSFPVTVIPFIYSTSMASVRLLQNSPHEYKLFPPSTGPSIQRLINKIKKNEQNAHSKEKKEKGPIISDSLSSGSGNGSQMIRIGGANKSQVNWNIKADEIDKSLESILESASGNNLFLQTDGLQEDGENIDHDSYQHQSQNSLTDTNSKDPKAGTYGTVHNPGSSFKPPESHILGQTTGPTVNQTPSKLNSQKSAGIPGPSNDPSHQTSHASQSQSSPRSEPHLQNEIKKHGPADQNFSALDSNRQNHGSDSNPKSDSHSNQESPLFDPAKTRGSKRSAHQLNSIFPDGERSTNQKNLSNRLTGLNKQENNPSELQSEEKTKKAPAILGKSREKTKLEEGVEDSLIHVSGGNFNEAGIEKVARVSNATCVAIESPKFTGYLVAAFGSHKKIDPGFISLMKQRLTQFLQSQGEKISSDDKMEIKIREIEFEAWAVAQAEFLKKSVHHGNEVAMAFFPTSHANPKLQQSEHKEMLQVSIDDIHEDKAVEFDLFIYLPSNKKYILYTHNGEFIGGEQKGRLKSRGIDHLHFRKEDAANFKKYHAEKYLDGKILEYEQKAKNTEEAKKKNAS